MPKVRETLFERDDAHRWADQIEGAILVVFTISVFAAAGPVGDLLARIFPNIF